MEFPSLPLQSFTMVPQLGITYNGTIAYCPQEAWIIPGTLRDNVLFGSELDEKALEKIYAVCNLTPDIKRMKLGDLYEVGEHGIQH